MTGALLIGLEAAKPPKRKKDPERWSLWALSGLLGAVAVMTSIWSAGPLVGGIVGFLLSAGRKRWRAGALSLGISGLMVTPWVLWLVATGFVPIALFIGDMAAPVELLWVLALGPLLLGVLTIGSAGMAGAMIGGVLGAGIAYASGGDFAACVLMLAPVLALSIPRELSTSKAAPLRALAMIGPCLLAGVMALASVHARYAGGLPAYADPFAQDRFEAARCETALIAMEDLGGSGFASARLEDQILCRWLGVLTAAPVILTELPAGSAPPLRQRLGPLALEGGDALLISFPPRTPEQVAGPLLMVVEQERVELPLHLDRVQEVDLSLVRSLR